MGKIKTFPAPPANSRFGGETAPLFTVEKASGAEQAIFAEDENDFNSFAFTADPKVSTADKLVGFLVRGAVDIARYQRTLHNEQVHRITDESRSHMNRLIRCVATSSTVRFQELYSAAEDQARFIEDVETGISSADWASIPWAPVPTVTISQEGESDIKNYGIEFIDQQIIAV